MPPRKWGSTILPLHSRTDCPAGQPVRAVRGSWREGGRVKENSRASGSGEPQTGTGSFQGVVKRAMDGASSSGGLVHGPADVEYMILCLMPHPLGSLGLQP